MSWSPVILQTHQFPCMKNNKVNYKELYKLDNIKRNNYHIITLRQEIVNIVKTIVDVNIIDPLPRRYMNNVDEINVGQMMSIKELSVKWLSVISYKSL